jgi:hypothetical protein
MGGLVSGCGEVGNERNIQVFVGVGGYIRRREHWLFGGIGFF